MALKANKNVVSEMSSGDYATLGHAYGGKPAGPIKACPVHLAMSSCK
jgi:hypothetical protein